MTANLEYFEQWKVYLDTQLKSIDDQILHLEGRKKALKDMYTHLDIEILAYTIPITDE